MNIYFLIIAFFFVKVAQQLRFIREWSVFGKTLSLSMKELCAAAGATLGLLLVYAQLGFLVSTAYMNMLCLIRFLYGNEPM